MTLPKHQRVLAQRGITADSVLDRVRETLRLTKDAELADLFGVSRPTIAAWRKRNRIPFAELLALSFEGKADFVYCLLGTPAPSRITPNLTRFELQLAREHFAKALRLLDQDGD